MVNPTANPLPATHSASRTEVGLRLALVLLVALNLRPFLTAVGPLASRIAGETGLDYQGMAWLTLLPMVLMGIGAFLGTLLTQRIGARQALLGALMVLGAGSALRALVPGGGAGSGSMLILTAALCGAGVAVVQAAFPGEIKRHFPLHVPLVTGLYSAALMGGGALGAQLTPLLTEASGNWRQALAFWAAPVGLALVLALVTLPRERSRAGGTGPSLAMLRRPRTWLLMSGFGLVNGGYASAVAWLAPYFQAQGWSPATSGGLVALMAIAQGVSALALPALSGNRRDRRPWLGLALVAQALGFAGLAFLPGLAPQLWVMILGAGLGGCFALMMIAALEHLPDPQEAGALSALMQGGGFLLASLPPWLLAVLHGASGSFALGWGVHVACVLVVLGLSTHLNPERYAEAMGLPPSSSTT
ncbi:putative transporter YycB [compost metagenome]